MRYIHVVVCSHCAVASILINNKKSNEKVYSYSNKINDIFRCVFRQTDQLITKYSRTFNSYHPYKDDTSYHKKIH